MYYKITNLKMPITSPDGEVISACAKTAGLKMCDILSHKILKKSIDARKKQISFIYSVLIETDKRVILSDNVAKTEIKKNEPIAIGSKKLSHRPVIVGFGPCGMFCALTLARLGYNPIVLERGGNVDERCAKINKFWSGSELDENTNVQFGEGGAGTFSDGKLTCRTGDDLIEGILEDFVRHGAPEDILFSALPHIGTDILKNVVKSIRKEIISLGGKVLFNTAVSDLVIKDKKIVALLLSDGTKIPCDIAVFAIGHSARDTYEMLYRNGILMVAKTFSVGVRCEHLKDDIDKSLYGDFAGHPALGSASYKLSNRKDNIGCYSFCMCPGGTVVTASSEKGMVSVNGMSNRARDNVNSNSAICINVGAKDFGTHPLSGVAFQRELERAAFLSGGKSYASPVQRLGDYIDGVKTTRLGKVTPSVTRGYEFFDLNTLFSAPFNSFLKESFAVFDKKITGFADSDTVLTGVETRTSAPLRILRNENLQSDSLCGFYPAGEGAGYAGGIMSAAVDGIKCAHQIAKVFCPG